MEQLWQDNSSQLLTHIKFKMESPNLRYITISEIVSSVKSSTPVSVVWHWIIKCHGSILLILLIGKSLISDPFKLLLDWTAPTSTKSAKERTSPYPQQSPIMFSFLLLPPPQSFALCRGGGLGNED